MVCPLTTKTLAATNAAPITIANVTDTDTATTTVTAVAVTFTADCVLDSAKRA